LTIATWRDAMRSANMRRPLAGMTAVAAMLGWLQLAPAFGFPVTAPAGMLERLFGVGREAGPVGWLLLLLGLAAFVAIYFRFVDSRADRPVRPIAFAVGAWLSSGTVVMTVVGILQGPPVPNDPMRVDFFMLNLGIGAAGESLVGWLLFGAVLAAGAKEKVTATIFALAVGAAALAAALALAAPGLGAQGNSDRVVEGRLAALPTGPVFASVAELPQPAGAVLGPHMHIAGFVADVSGTATMVMAGTVVDVGPGEVVFTADQVAHDHENRVAVPFAIALATVIIGLTVAALIVGERRPIASLMAALLVAGTVATIDPLMNHWYFIGVRAAAQRGGSMPVAAAHRTFESENLTGLPSGPVIERLTLRRIGPGESVHFAGPAAIVVLDGDASLLVNGSATRVSAQSGRTVAGGADATVQPGPGGARVLVLQLLPAS